MNAAAKPATPRKPWGKRISPESEELTLNETPSGGGPHRHLGKQGRVVGVASNVAHEKLAPSALIKLIQGGLKLDELEKLRAILDLPMEKLAATLGISKATLHRRKASGRLDPGESDRVVRFARLVGKAVDVFESQEDARTWLSSPQVGLGGAAPLEYAATEVGAREVENLLGRIEYGVYS